MWVSEFILGLLFLVSSYSFSIWFSNVIMHALHRIYWHYLSRYMLRNLVPPMLSIPNQLEGAYQGQDVTLECHTEAYPASINYWTTDKGDMIISGEFIWIMYWGFIQVKLIYRSDWYWNYRQRWQYKYLLWLL